jgi:hypothetical protein
MLAAPFLFVLLWSSSFIAAKAGLRHLSPLLFVAIFSRQTILQRVKRGEIQAVHVKQGRKKGLRLKVIRTQTDLFNQTS